MFIPKASKSTRDQKLSDEQTSTAPHPSWYLLFLRTPRCKPATSFGTTDRASTGQKIESASTSCCELLRANRRLMTFHALRDDLEHLWGQSRQADGLR